MAPSSDSTVTDLRRELSKAEDALSDCFLYLSRHAQGNAALHCSERVMYSPLHAKVEAAIAGIVHALKRTEPEDVPPPAAQGSVKMHRHGAEMPTSSVTDNEQLQRRLNLAHQQRRAKEAQLDGIRRALLDVGVIEENDPYSHADLEDMIRQTIPTDAKLLEDARAALQRVRVLPEIPKTADADDPHLADYLIGYGNGARAAKRAIENPPATTEDRKTWDGGYFDNDGRPTDWDGRPLGYHQMTEAGWGYCDGCRTWSQATKDSTHDCPMTYMQVAGTGDAPKEQR
jgi:hypothetical protein